MCSREGGQNAENLDKNLQEGFWFDSGIVQGSGESPLRNVLGNSHRALTTSKDDRHTHAHTHILLHVLRTLFLPHEVGMDRGSQAYLSKREKRPAVVSLAVTLKEMMGCGQGMKLHHIMHHVRHYSR